MDDAGIAHADVDAPEGLHGRVDQRLDLLRIAHVAGDEPRIVAQLLRLGAAAGRIEIAQDDFRALLNEGLGAGEPDASRGSGDDGDFVLQSSWNSKRSDLV